MKNLIFVIVTLLCLFSCQKETEIIFVDNPIETRTSNKIFICHTTGMDKFKLIEVNANEILTHLNHGDAYPEECYRSGFFMNRECKLIDVSINKEVCGNGFDDNCDGLTDSEDEESCGCPCFSMADALKAPNQRYYDYRISNCAQEFVGFSQPGSCNYGASTQFSVAISPDCGICTDLSFSEASACVKIIEAVQRIKGLPDYCNGFDQQNSKLSFLDLELIN
jgi:hypothetical protein